MEPSMIIPVGGNMYLNSKSYMLLGGVWIFTITLKNNFTVCRKLNYLLMKYIEMYGIYKNIYPRRTSCSKVHTIFIATHGDCL